MEILNEDICTWHSFKAGDKDSFQLIYFRYYHPLYEYGMRIASDEEVVKDSIHDLFVKLWKNKANLGDVTAIRAYLMVALRSTLYNNFQKNNRNPRVGINENVPFEIVFSVESDYIKKETEFELDQKLTDALNRLTPRQKEVIYLRYLEEMEYPEIAGLMNITIKGVYKLTARALEALRQTLSISELFAATLTFSIFLKYLQIY